LEQLLKFSCNEKEIRFFIKRIPQELRVIWFCENYAEY